MGTLKDLINSDAWVAMSKALKEGQQRFAAETEQFWGEMSYEDQLKCFHYVCSKIHQGDVIEQGSYRYVLYDVFGFDMDSYGLGMEAGYLDIHNLISSGIDHRDIEEAKVIKVLIDGEHREVLTTDKGVKLSYDKESRTLVLAEKKRYFEAESEIQSVLSNEVVSD